MESMSDRLFNIVADLDRREKAAAARNKVTLWAYYHQMRRELSALFEGRPRGETESIALTMVTRADVMCASLPVADAARLWAVSIYCARIAGLQKRRSLAWLRERAGVTRQLVEVTRG